VRGQVVSRSTRSSKQGVVCEQKDNVEDNGENSNGSEYSSSEIIIFVKARNKGTFNSCFRKRK
jgi:hypothetical protein